jgi:DNA modification methylase
MILHGDCLLKLSELKDNSIDAIVTDPPYGLKFMGKSWDYDVPSVGIWQEVLRVLKPGGHLLSFGGTRTYHRMVVNIEDAGFEIRDQVQWIYGSGFPKSHDVSKGIDKQAGSLKEIGTGKSCPDIRANNFSNSEGKTRLEIKKSIPNSNEAKEWQGWGTALKPANEPIVLARKPLEKGLTVAQNVLKWGTGAINVDESRIGTDKIRVIVNDNMQGGNYGANKSGKTIAVTEHQGWWPSNVILDEQAAFLLDEQASEVSRFFYVAKASKRERGTDNNHPTVKPIKLMTYLIKLITPPQGTVLDPFAGSGSTGVACKALGLKFIGIEREKEYVEIATRRIEAAV